VALVRHLRSASASAVGLCFLLTSATVAQEAVAQETVTWLADRGEAIAQARKQGKLLLVVQLSGDFARNAADSSEAKTYRGTALADPGVARVLHERYVVTYQQVGEAESLRKLHPVKTQPVRTEFAATYVCLPDLRVLHFIPGFVTSAELLEELKWAGMSYRAIVELPAMDEGPAARRAHLAAAAKGDVALFERAFKTRWTGEALAAGPSTVDLPAALSAARGTLELSLSQRLGKSWQRTPAQDAIAALTAHGGLGREMAHLTLGEFPLVPLGDLERPAFEACTGDRFWQASRRRQSLANWWTAGASSGKPLMLVVADDAFAPGAGESSALAWPPAKADALPLHAQFVVSTLSLDEFAALATDAKWEPQTYRAAAPPRFMVFAAGGKPSALLGKGTSLNRLAQAMTAASGAGARTALAAGESIDDDH